jgi:hypothetical protein
MKNLRIAVVPTETGNGIDQSSDTIDINKWISKECINWNYSILLILAALHNEKKITDAKLKGQFMALRNGTLNKRRNVYHCEINNKWYNDKPASYIWGDLAKLTSGYIYLSTFIKYLKQYENKNLNHAINIFGSEYIYRLYNNWNPDFGYNDFFANISFHCSSNINITADKISHECDCCGRSSYEYKKDKRNDMIKLNNWLHSKKQGNLSKIPVTDIESRSYRLY